MKYTLRLVKEEAINVEPKVSIAIETYRKIKKAEHKIEKLEGELNGWLSELSIKEIDDYVKITSQIE